MSEIKPLTSLRGIAAMAVVLQHFSATAQKHAATTIPSLVPHGYMAVDLFFVLSGFIMTYTYLADFEAQGVRAFPTFMGKRVARIVPLNLLAVALVVLAGAASQALLSRNIFHDSHNLAFDVAANAFMVQGLGIGTNLNGPSWSLSTEFAAYFLFPLFLALILHPRRIVAVVALALSTLILCWMASMNTRLGLADDSTLGGIGRCFTEFCLGMGTYRVIQAPRIRDFLARDAIAMLILAASAAMLVLRVDLFAALLFPAVVATLACNRGRVAAAFSTRIPYFLGVISFSIYLLHNMFRPIELLILQTVHPAPLSTPVALAFALFGSLTVIPFAWLAYVAVERPGRTVVRALIAAPRQAFGRV